MDHVPSRRRRLGFTLLAIGLAFVVLEALSLLAGRILGPRLDVDVRRTARVLEDQTRETRVLLDDPNTLILLDSLLGWRYRPGYESPMHAINSAGHRSAREYAAAVPPGIRRVASFGDSFVYGNEVPNAASWTAQLEAAHPEVEVLNYGVGGFGTDQALLLFLREGMAFGPEVVLIGFAPVNLRRTQNVYRRFISTQEPPLVKPRFRLDELGRLALIPNPLPRREDWEALAGDPRRALELGEHDEWYDPVRYRNPLHDWSATVRLGTAVGLRLWRKYLWEDRLLDGPRFRVQSPAFALQRALLNAFADSVRSRGAQPVLLLLPDRDSVTGLRAGGPVVYAPMRDSLVADGRAVVIDLLDAFAAQPAAADPWSWFAPGGHYSAEGNRVVAEWVFARLPKD